jgi:hypothetical protein
MTGRARARRLCQTAIGVFIDPQKAIYDLAREEVGEQFDRFFPERTSLSQRLLASIVEDFRPSGLDDEGGEHLASVATDLFARYGLTSAELAGMAKAEIGTWAAGAGRLVCGRGLTSRTVGFGTTVASGNQTPRVEVDPVIEGRLRALVEAFYRALIPLTLGSDLRGALDGFQSELLREIAAKLDGLVRPPEAKKPFSIPTPVGDFKGYEKELVDVRAALTGGGAVAISAVHGMGGVGKSELARKVARETLAHFDDGQILVDMLGTTQPRSAADAMTHVLLALGGGDGRPADAGGGVSKPAAGQAAPGPARQRGERCRARCAAAAPACGTPGHLAQPDRHRRGAADRAREAVTRGGRGAARRDRAGAGRVRPGDPGRALL